MRLKGFYTYIKNVTIFHCVQKYNLKKTKTTVYRFLRLFSRCDAQIVVFQSLIIQTFCKHDKIHTGKLCIKRLNQCYVVLFQADQICYAVLCVFSYFAAGQEQKKAILQQAARLPHPPQESLTPAAATRASSPGYGGTSPKGRASPQVIYSLKTMTMINAIWTLLLRSFEYG